MILALIAFPEAQRKAHEELDRVIGSDRAPLWEDLEDLPYIRALVNEVARFRPIAPLIPRYTIEDFMVCHIFNNTSVDAHHSHQLSQYRGYKIPKDSAVIVNVCECFYEYKNRYSWLNFSLQGAYSMILKFTRTPKYSIQIDTCNQRLEPRRITNRISVNEMTYLSAEAE